MKAVVFAIGAVFVAASPSFSQKLEDGWKGLLPYKSTVADVEKVLGKGRENTDKWRIWQYGYDTAEAVVSADYADAPCLQSTVSFDRLDVPAGTLLRYYVELKQVIPVTEVRYDTNRFERDLSRSDEPLPNFHYRQFMKELNIFPNEWSAGYGIEFWGDVIKGRDFIKGFRYGQPYGEREKRPCSQPSPSKP